MLEISTSELKKLMGAHKPFILLDCRGVDYYNWEHLPHAINLRWKYIQSRAEKMFPDKTTLIITSCDGFACNASVRCYENLKKLGFTNLLEYSGGISDWAAHGEPTEKDKRYRIAENIYRFPEQKFYEESVGSYLIETDDSVTLIDGPQNLTEEHEDFILHFGKPIQIFLSHGPTGGASEILQKQHGAKIYLHKADAANNWLRVKPNVLFEDGFAFAKHLTVIHTPGHTPGSSTLYDRKNKLLFTGDHIQGNKQGTIYDFIKNDDGVSGNPTERLKSAKKLLEYEFDAILPFHYDMILGNAKAQLTSFISTYEHNHN
ncbi:MAG: rhodanese-like domain-containing protein [bacterium]|nr:rhodanese-like domain-containing protein [bacterium]